MIKLVKKKELTNNITCVADGITLAVAFHSQSSYLARKKEPQKYEWKLYREYNRLFRDLTDRNIKVIIPSIALTDMFEIIRSNLVNSGFKKELEATVQSIDYMLQQNAQIMDIGFDYNGYICGCEDDDYDCNRFSLVDFCAKNGYILLTADNALFSLKNYRSKQKSVSVFTLNDSVERSHK